MNNKDKTLVIGIEGELISLELRAGESESIEVIDRDEWENDGSTSEKLLERIDTFLERNIIKVDQLKEVKTDIDENQRYTLFRIVETVARTINYCLK